MDFSFTEEQRQLEDTVRRFVAKDYAFEKRRAIRASAEGWSREAWQALADLGLLALNVPEEHGGLGGEPVDTLLVMNALGPGLPLEPYLASAVVATSLIRDAAAAGQQADLLPALAAGEAIAVLAHDEPGARGRPAHVATHAVEVNDGWNLDGHKCVVAHAAAADQIIVSARSSGDEDDEQGISLFLVPRSAPGLSLQAYPTLDGTRAAEVRLAGVRMPAAARIGAINTGFAAVERAQGIGLAALCAEAVGIMKATIDATVDYLRTRQQFGQPIGRFQALQHRAADMLLHYEQAKSMSLLAAMRCTSQDTSERRRALAAAKVVIGRAARFIGQQAVQLHGGMGMSDELIVSHWFKRLTAIELSQGDSDTHLQYFIEASAPS
jgi:alkylation response protein AidB-like acyl-CoA dehydrogenase